jgi:NAD(P)-dependent dehydrogenase (short-subunit alcohol dehydrogenase family)
MPSVATRVSIFDQLQIDLPDIDWLPGALPAGYAHKTESKGAVYTLQAQQGPNDQWISRRIVVQVFLPCIVKTNTTSAVFTDQSEIEAAVDAVLDSVRNVQVGGDDYWFVRPERINYLLDPNQQPTRAEIMFITYDGSTWA